MGNICRSPAAEGLFRHHLQNSDLNDHIAVDSAGTHGYHQGAAPDHRMIAVAACFDVDISHLNARQVTNEDFYRFDLMLAMDRDNQQRLQRQRPSDARARIQLMLDYHPDTELSEVPDPYYGGREGFIQVCELLDVATAGLLDRLPQQIEDHRG